jgi:hypothetical protein
VEGGELSVLKGGAEVMGRRPRSVMLIEVEDRRTRPWGYPAQEIGHFLSIAGSLPDGTLKRLAVDAQEYNGNFVAVSDEQPGSATAGFAL